MDTVQESSPRPVAADSTMTRTALEQLAAVLDGAQGQLVELAERARRLHDELAEGMPLADAMAAEARPLLITRMTRLVEQLNTAGLAVRRAEARQLRVEGLSQEQTAEVFGVSRQRVAALLRPAP